MTRRRVTVAAIALGVLMLSAGAGAARKAADNRYRDAAGWSAEIPGGWQHETSRTKVTLLDSFETTISNFAAGAGIKDTITRNSATVTAVPPLDSSGAFPATGVALRIGGRYGGPYQEPPASETPLPLALGQFKLLKPYPNDAYAAKVPIPRVLDIFDAGYFGLEVWIGVDASAADVAALRSLVSSFGVPRNHPRPGSPIVGKAADFPVGSATLRHFSTERGPSYVVHAPHGFYAVTWWYPAIRGQWPYCNLKWDRSAEQFYCGNLKDVRWSRAGTPIGRSEGLNTNAPLDLSGVTTTWDGYIELSGRSLARGEFKRLWRS